MGAKKFREVRTKLAEAAGFLYRDEDEVRDMAGALGLKEAGRPRGEDWERCTA